MGPIVFSRVAQSELAIVHVFKVFFTFCIFQFFAGICCSIYVAEVDFREVNSLGFKLFFGGKGGGQDGTIIMRLCAHYYEKLDSCNIVFRWLLAFGESERNYIFSSRLLFEGSVACPAPPPLLPSPSMIDVVAFACAGSVVCPARPP